MTESTVIRLSIKKSPLQTLYATGVSIEEGSLPSGYLHRIQNAVSEELTRLTSSHGLLEQRTELLRRLIEANGGHEQGETWADAADRIIEIRRSHDAALDDQQRSTKEVLADTLAALQSCDGSTDPTDDNFADTVDWSVARFAGEVRHAAQCHAERACHKQGIVQPRSPYDRLVVQRGTGVAMYVDVYEILAAFDTGSSVLDHLVKKALAPGQRHAKDRAKDLEEIEWSATCARMENEVAREKGGTEGDPVSLAEKRRATFAKASAEAFKDPKLGRAFHADLDDLVRKAKAEDQAAVIMVGDPQRYQVESAASRHGLKVLRANFIRHGAAYAYTGRAHDEVIAEALSGALTIAPEKMKSEFTPDSRQPLVTTEAFLAWANGSKRMSNYTYEELQELVARQQEEIDRLKGGSGPRSVGLDTPLSARATALREARGMTKVELARRMGVSDALIGSIENGTIKQVGHLRLTAMARAFGLTVSELLGETTASS